MTPGSTWQRRESILLATTVRPASSRPRKESTLSVMTAQPANTRLRQESTLLVMTARQAPGSGCRGVSLAMHARRIPAHQREVPRSCDATATLVTPVRMGAVAMLASLASTRRRRVMLSAQTALQTRSRMLEVRSYRHASAFQGPRVLMARLVRHARRASTRRRLVMLSALDAQQAPAHLRRATS